MTGGGSWGNAILVGALSGIASWLSLSSHYLIHGYDSLRYEGFEGFPRVVADSVVVFVCGFVLGSRMILRRSSPRADRSWWPEIVAGSLLALMIYWVTFAYR